MQVFSSDLNNPQVNHADNGNMDFAQRRGTLTITNGQTGYVLDRLKLNASGSTAKSFTVAIDNTVLPSGLIVPATTSAACANNTAVAAPAATDTFQPYMIITEGLRTRHLNQGWITVGFHFWAAANGVIPVAVRDASTVNSYVQTVNVTAGYGYYVVYVPLTSITIPATSGIGFWIDIASVSGTSYQAPTLNQWVSGNYVSHASATNWFATTGLRTRLAQYQIRQGIIPYNEMLATFSRKGGSIDGEHLILKRYCEVLYPDQYIAYVYSNVAGMINIPYSVIKRATPVITGSNFAGLSQDRIVVGVQDPTAYMTIGYNGANQNARTVSAVAISDADF